MKIVRLVLLSASLAWPAIGGLGPPRAAAQGNEVVLQTVPPVPGIVIAVGAGTVTTDASGMAVASIADADSVVVDVRTLPADAVHKVEFLRWGDGDRKKRRSFRLPLSAPVLLGLRVYQSVQLEFVDPAGRPVGADRVEYALIRGSTGEVIRLSAPFTYWLLEVEAVRRLRGFGERILSYSAQEVLVDGSNVVNRNQQRFAPADGQDVWRLELLLNTISIEARDAVFRRSVGSGVSLTFPDGAVRTFPFDEQGRAVLNGVARGNYSVEVTGVELMTPPFPMVVSRDQDVELVVITRANAVIGGGLGLFVAAALFLFGRRRYVASLIQRGVKRGSVLLLALGIALGASSARAASPEVDRATALPQRPIPLLAYYYIWFEHSSWERAKSDWPLLGRYSSDDVEVMRKQVAWAKASGIDGFIVSWRNSPHLNQRLADLVRVANDFDFKLALMYQGLDFARQPIGAGLVAEDLDFFAREYEDNAAFTLFEKPLVIWSGTWEFTPEDVRRVTEDRRESLLILASERDVEGIRRLGLAVDGNAYYWSSVNPGVTPGYEDKLLEMSAEVDGLGGYWIAPAAPGFDARLIGGTRVVERHDGETLKAQLAAAGGSSPDAIGIISWNEFSENTHVEPSRAHGDRELNVISEFRRGVPLEPVDFSSEPETDGPTTVAPAALAAAGGGLALLIIGAVAVALRRRRSSDPDHADL